MRSLIVVAILLLSLPSRAATPPNIVYILADDMGYADVSFHHGDIRTPNIDRIANSGAKLEQFYVQPVCSPTRASFMTGRYPLRYGLQQGVVRPWAQYGVPLEETFLAQRLKQAGYETAICGKWHLGHFQPDYLPTHRGFDHQYGHYNGAIDYFTHIRDGGLDWHRDDRVSHDEGYSTFLVAKEAIRILNEHDASKPLFLYVPFNAVHAPHQVPSEYEEGYPNLTGQRKIYAGMCAAMDEAIGTILDAIEKKGIRGNTLILFSSDNGGPNPGKVTSNVPLRAGKATLYEGGVRVCAAACWDGHIKPGSSVNEPIHMVDWYPTLCKLAGVSIADQKAPLDGLDVWPTITDGAKTPHEFIIHNSTPASGAIRKGDWKLILNGHRVDSEGPGEELAAADGKEPPAAKKANQKKELVELFNIAKDPSEKENLATKEPEKLKELKAAYDTVAAQAVPSKQAPPPKGFKSPKVWGEQN